MKLTHEQAAFLKAAMVDDTTDVEPLVKAGLLRGYPATEYWLSSAGEQALAAYDQEWVIVPRQTVARLHQFCAALTCIDPVSAELEQIAAALAPPLT